MRITVNTILEYLAAESKKTNHNDYKNQQKGLERRN